MAGQLQQIVLAFDQNGLEAALEDMADGLRGGETTPPAAVGFCNSGRIRHAIGGSPPTIGDKVI
jgi:hypothetical protein